MKEERFAILGGAFNPVTKGHIAIANAVINENICDKVLMMPCYSHMFEKKMVNPNKRLKMCEIAIESQEHRDIVAYNYEIYFAEAFGKMHYSTYELMLHLTKVADHKFSLIIGMDNANNFHKWANYEELMNLVRFIVVTRAGVPRNENVNWYMKSPHTFLGEVRPPDRQVQRPGGRVHGQGPRVCGPGEAGPGRREDDGGAPRVVR